MARHLVSPFRPLYYTIFRVKPLQPLLCFHFPSCFFYMPYQSPKRVQNLEQNISKVDASRRYIQPCEGQEESGNPHFRMDYKMALYFALSFSLMILVRLK